MQRFLNVGRLSLVLLILACLFSISAVDITENRSDPEIAIHTISPLLLINADAIVRNDQRRFEIRGPGNGRMYVHKIITVLNSNGLSHASINIPYNSFVDVRRVGGAVYDADGNRVRRIRNRDFEDESMISNISLAEDSRVKKGTFTHSVFPFTIEIEYRLDYSGFIQLPPWIPINREKTSLEKAEMEVILPRQLNFDYRMFNVSEENVHVYENARETHFKWTLEDLHGIEREFMGPPWFELLPAVVMKTDLFNMEGYEGSLDDWSTFAGWFGKLWEGRDELPDYLRHEVDLMIEEHGVTLELIGEIYSYLQNSTRYVSIQLGIGGFQTETAAITANNRYGDCKALSNLLLAMLRYAGFEAHPALIRNGSYTFPFDPDFVHNPFNHAVIAIPFEQDTIWAEATSTTLPLGYIGSSNSNRYALLFNENGGQLVRTPSLSPGDNYQFREATISLMEDGSAEATIQTRYGGSQHERIRSLTRQGPRIQSQNLRRMLPFNLFEILDAEIAADLELPKATVDLGVAIQSFSNRVGSRLMFHPNIMERQLEFVSSDESRTQPVYTGSAYHDIDEITFLIPEGFRIEAIPEPVKLEFNFGTYSSNATLSDVGSELHYRREIKMKPAVIPAEEFETYRTFINEVVRSDNNQVVLVKE